MNRDYDFRPRQGGSRDGYGYGHSDLPDDPMSPNDKRVLVGTVLLSALFTAFALYGAWVWLDSL